MILNSDIPDCFVFGSENIDNVKTAVACSTQESARVVLGQSIFWYYDPELKARINF